MRVLTSPVLHSTLLSKACWAESRVTTGVFETADYRVLPTLLFGKLGFLNQVGSSHQLCSKLKAVSLTKADLVVSTFHRPFEVVLDSGQDVGSLSIVL